MRISGAVRDGADRVSCDSWRDDLAGSSLPDDIEALQAALVAERARGAAEVRGRRPARRRRGDGRASEADDRQVQARQFGQSSERCPPSRSAGAPARGAGSDGDRGRTGRRQAAAKAARSRQELRSARSRYAPPLPAHLPRERVVIPAPCSCPCCGGKLAKLGEDITETLEVIPRQWKVIQTVREKFSCRACETITQPPAPFHPIAARPGRCRPAGDDPPRQVRQSPAVEPAERELRPRGHRSRRVDAGRLGRRLHRNAGAAGRADPPHVLGAARIHGDDTTVPVLAKMQDQHRPIMDLCARRSAVRRTIAARRHLLLLARPGRRASEPASGVLCGDPSGRRLWRIQRSLRSRPKPGPITEAACWSHGRRKFFVLADIDQAARRGHRRSRSPGRRWRMEAVRRIDRSLDAERAINGLVADKRLAVRQDPSRAAGGRSGSLDAHRARQALASRRRRQGDGLHAQALGRLHPLPRRRPHLSHNNAAERALRCVALGRRHWLFCGSDRGGERAAAMYSLIVDRQAQRRRSRRPGSPTCSRASTIIRHPGSTNSCRGTGRAEARIVAWRHDRRRHRAPQDHAR